ncbi:hypothetical protein CCACVL1_20751 [Corchorus capsularis]|uniref:Uncharacterized protein n=1 Tax=Corchorus capsularis TaxID=210143 RepID=A0A1R3HA17_COCAP|nr:hypothetical protein CCACVL1_20751 [Corchorus capsularis]
MEGGRRMAVSLVAVLAMVVVAQGPRQRIRVDRA